MAYSLGENFKWSKFKAHSHDIFFSWTLDLLLINSSSRYLQFGVYFSPHQINIVCEYKLQRKQTFSLVSDIDVEKSCSFNAKLKWLMNNFWFFSVSWRRFWKQMFADVIQNRCFYSGFKRDSNKGAFQWILREVFKNSLFIMTLWWLLLHFFKSN